MIVVWSLEAGQNLLSIGLYIARRDRRAAKRTVTTIESSVALLDTFPQRGRVGRLRGTRELSVPGTKYIVPYRLKGDVCEIIAVFHSAQAWPTAL